MLQHRKVVLPQRGPPPFDSSSSEPVLKAFQTVDAVTDVGTADLRALSHRGSEWRWLNTITFWIASCFIIGSILFVVGAATSMLGPIMLQAGSASWKYRVLVDYAYGIGATYFLIGAYLGWFEVINVGKSRRRFCAGPSEGVSASGFWGAFTYFAGAVSFQFACIATLVAPTSDNHFVVWLEWVPQVVGGLCFTIAACIELRHNHAATWRHRVFWLCVFYLAGSFLFFLAASIGLGLAVTPTVSREALHMWGVDFVYLIGSLAFFCGAWLQLQMWHAQQFGLGFIRELNETFHQHAQPIDPDQQLALAMYMFNGALSAINICLSFVSHRQVEPARLAHAQQEALIEAEQILGDTTAFVAAHCMLLLATTVRFAPSLQPYGYLIQLMRGVSALFLASGVLHCARYLSESDRIFWTAAAHSEQTLQTDARQDPVPNANPLITPL